MINLLELTNCLYKLGNSHPSIIGVKKVLNSCSGVKISNIPYSNVFCRKTKEALIQFQSFNRLTQTGTMSLETWQTIGKNLGIIRFEATFFHTSNYKILHNLAFGNKFIRLFPTSTHQLLIEYAFFEGKSEYGDRGGGLSRVEVDAIVRGSRLSDTYFGHGYSIGGLEIDIPITLLISEAYKHAMTPEGMTVDDARREGHKWIIRNTTEAWRIQQKKNVSPIPSPAPVPNVPTAPKPRKLSLEALKFFGKACHTYMDSESPAHHGWQEYKMPKGTARIDDPRGVQIGEYEFWDWWTFVHEGLQHKADESDTPTQSQKDNSILYMRGAFLTTFTNQWFKRAVKTEGERQKVYNFVRANGLSWEEDFSGQNRGDSNNLQQVKIPRGNIQNN